MQLAAQGDVVAFEALYSKHYRRGVRHATRWLRRFTNALDPNEVAKDVVQEAWVMLWRRGFRASDSFPGLYASTIRLCALHALREHRFVQMRYQRRPGSRQGRFTSTFPTQIFGCSLSESCDRLTLHTEDVDGEDA